MIGRGPDYLDDYLLARKLADEELNRDKQLVLAPYIEKADKAYARLLEAEDRGDSNIAKCKIEYERDLKVLTEALKRFDQQKMKSSSSFIHSSLMFSPESKESPAAMPVRIFTDIEIRKIQSHYEKLPAPLQNLMNAALGEDIFLESITNPVFIRGEGQIYNANNAIALLKAQPEAPCPHNQELKFSKSDIIPCNTLLEAMGHLLEIIDQGNQVKAKSVDHKRSILAGVNSGPKRVRISSAVIDQLEHHYKNLPAKHQLLFSTVCRDPMTNKIMDDPVMLPDGYMYDRETANLYLIMTGTCPKNEKITFTQNDITSCVTVIKVLDQLRDNMIAASKQAQAVHENSVKREDLPSPR